MLVLVTYISVMQRNAVRQQINDNLDFVLNLTNNNLEQQITQTKTLLRTLANTSRVRALQDGACSHDLSIVLEDDTTHTGLVVADRNGNPVCSAFKDATTATSNISDRPYFQEVLKTKSFVVSSFAVGRFSGKPVILLAYPILDETGNALGAVIAAMDLAWMNETLAKSSLPANSSMMVLDHQDNIVARWPEPEKYIGTNVGSLELVKYIHALKQRRSEAVGVGIDGEERLYKHTHIAAANDHLHLYFGLPTDFADATANRVLVRNVGLALLVSLAMIVMIAVDWRIITTIRRLSSEK